MSSSLPRKTLLSIVNSKGKLGFVAVFFIILFKSDVYFLIYREKSDDFIWQLTRQFCWDFVNHLQLACVKRQIKGDFMNGLIIPYNVNKYTQAFVRREGMHFVMSLNYCWYIIFVHFHWGWLRLSEFCLFIFMVLGSLTIKILVNQVLFHPTSPWDVGLRRSDHFTSCFYFCCLEQCKTRTWYCDFCHAFYLIGEFPIDQMKQSDWSEQIACRFQANHQPI